MRKAYISCPISVKQTELDKVAADLRSRGFEVTHWIRGTSYGFREKEAISSCTHFIIMLPNNGFVCEDLKSTCIGVYNELMAYGKTNTVSRAGTYLAYTTQNNSLNYYGFDYNSDTSIKGTPGSYEWFHKHNPYISRGPAIFRFKTEQEFKDEYRKNQIDYGEDIDDIDVDSWRNDFDEWDNDHNYLFGTVYPYDEFKPDAEFFDEIGEDEIYVYNSMLILIKPEERINPPSWGKSGNTSYDVRLLLRKK